MLISVKKVEFLSGFVFDIIYNGYLVETKIAKLNRCQLPDVVLGR